MKIEHWPGLTPYTEGVARMEAYVAEVLAGGEERVIFCEHEPVLTVGTSGNVADVGADVGVPVVETGRGGKVTYHGPGQRVVYLVVRLERWGKDVRAYVKWLQGWLVDSLEELGINASTNDDIGVWVRSNELQVTSDEKVAAIGVRVRRGVAFHGISLNITNDLGIYGRFVPCGISDRGVTRIKGLKGLRVEGLEDGALMGAVDGVLEAQLRRLLP